MKKTLKGFVLGVIITTILMSTVIGVGVKETIEVLFNSVNLSVNGSITSKVGENYTLDNSEEVPYSILYKGTTYLPIRKVSEILSKEVGWDGNTSTVSINDKGVQYIESSELNYDEQFIFDSVLKYSKNFKSPSSVRVLETNYLYDWNSVRTIKLQADNSYGATMTNYYFLFHVSEDRDVGSFSKGDIVKRDPSEGNINLPQDENIDLGKLNQAIIKYWQERGIE